MDSQKQLFSLREGVHYLNCAYKAPLLKTSEEACTKALHRGRNPSDIGVNDFFDDVDMVKIAFAELINAEASDIAVMSSVSYGFSSVLANTEPKKNGKALIIKDEFPSSYFALKRWCDEKDNKLSIISPPDSAYVAHGWNERVINSIDADTSVVVLSTVHWMNGLKFDLKAIGEKCSQVGAKFLVDGSQSVGALPINLNECKVDALICASYKWLFGPYSIALAYIGESFHKGRPLEEVWMNRANARDFSSLSDYEEQYLPGAARFNSGETSNFILMPLLLNSLRQLNTWKPINIQNYAEQVGLGLRQYLNDNGVGVDKEYQSHHLMGIKAPEGIDSSLLKEKLLEHKVFVSVRGDFIRVSVNVFNDHSDINKLIQILEDSKV